MIELTAEQASAIERATAPLHLADPRTGEVYVLIRKSVYDLTCRVVGGPGKAWGDDRDDDLIRQPA
jgi:hypothetical protein